MLAVSIQSLHPPTCPADAEFEENGLGGLVTVTQRDIEEGGFPEDLHGKADGVFLDLPKPYKVGAAWFGGRMARAGI